MYHDILFLNKTEKVVILDLVYKIFGKNNMPDIKWPLKCISPFQALTINSLYTDNQVSIIKKPIGQMGFLQCFSVFNDSADWNRLGFLNKISFFPLWLFCLQIFFKEFFHCIIKIKPVILVSKAMSFVVFYNIFHFNATLFQRSTI